MSIVKITDIQITSAAGSYIAADRGYFKDEGIDPQFLPMGAGDQITALVSGTADVAGSVITAQLYNALGRGLSLKMVGDHGSNLKNASAGGVVVRKDLADSGQWKGPADLKGKKVALALVDAVSEIDMYKYLQQAHLTWKDVDQVVLGFPEQLAAFANKSLDYAYGQEPFTTNGVAKKICVRGPIGYDLYPGQQIAALTFGQKLYADKQLTLAYLRAYVRGARDYVKALIDKDKATFDIVVPILVKHTSMKDPTLYSTTIPSGLKPDPLVNEKSVTDDLQYFIDKGSVKQKYDIAPFIDNGPVKQVIQALGPYTK
ncbi:MAG: ABC transporter substrate-binding protein [Chloroflexota bacterium]|nr:ABC transporter substrate-binding protein [Chloroflexota bacterium]